MAFEKTRTEKAPLEKTRRAGRSSRPVHAAPLAGRGPERPGPDAGAAQSCRRRDCPPGPSPVARSARGGFPSLHRRFAAAGRAGAALALLLVALAALPAQAQVDTTGPVPRTVESDAQGIVIYLDEDAVAADIPVSRFSVTVDGSPITVGTVHVGISGQTASDQVRLRGLSSRIRAGQTVVVTYTDPNPGSNDAMGVIQDALGNDAESFTTGENGVPAVGNISRYVPVTGVPRISGTGRVGQRLRALTHHIRDDSGLSGGTNYTYQWLHLEGTTETAIAGATDQTYTPTAADVGKRLGVRVNFQDNDANDYTLASTALAIHPAMPPASCPAFSAPAGRTQIWTGTVTVGQWFWNGYIHAYGFHGGGGGLDDRTFEIGANRYTVQGITARTSTNHPFEFTLASTLTAAEVATLRLHVCGETYAFADAQRQPVGSSSTYRWHHAGVDWSAVSSRTLHLTVGGNAAMGRPEIAGTAQVGERLTASAGTIADPDGPADPTLTWQWLRVDADGTSNQTAISGATSATYTPVGADAGGKLRVRASFTDLVGTFEARISDPYPSTGTVLQTPGLRLSERRLSLLEGGSRSYEVALTTEPGGQVIVTPRDQGDVTASPRSLEFTRENWGEAQTVTLMARLDGDADTDRVNVVNDATGAEYGGVSASVAVTVRDIDGAAVAGAVRLGGDSTIPGRGRVEVAYHGEWGTVCDDRMDVAGNLAPALACRMMGYADGRMVLNENSPDFNRSDTKIWLDDLRCLPGSVEWTAGERGRLDQCWHTGTVGLNNCTHREDLWVQCTGALPVGEDPMLPAGSALPTFYVKEARATEGRHNNLVFSVKLNPAATASVTVQYATADLPAGASLPPGPGRGRATAGVDYTAVSDMLTFAAGETLKTIEVPITNDSVEDSGEVLILRLSNITGNAQFSNPDGVGIIFNHDPPTAAFRDLPDFHDGNPFTVELAFSEPVEVDAERLRSALAVSGGALTALTPTAGSDTSSWQVTVQPAGTAAPVVLALPATAHCTDADAICTVDERGLDARVEGTVPVPGATTRATSASVTSGPGGNGTWDTGETVEAEVRFSDTVTLDGPPGVGPVLTILLDGTPREAAYTGGSGTDTLAFSHTVTAEDDGARRAWVAADGLSLNGATLGAGQGGNVDTGFDVAPWVTAVALAPDASGDRRWTPGESIDVHLAFSEAVTLSGGLPWLDVRIGGYAAPAALGYASGSGSATLVFSTGVPEGAGDFTGIAVVADSLVANGASIVSAASGLAAALGHDGTEPSAAPGTGESNALTAEFLDLPAGGHGTNPFTLELRFSEEFPLSYTTLQNHALGVTNGTLTGVARATQGENRVWNVSVAPSGGGAVTVALPETTDCTATGAICAPGQRMLAAVSATVPETAQAPPPTPFRVSADLPAEHDGASEITFEVSFNKEPQADYSYKTLRDYTLRIRQGGASLTPKVRRLNKPHNDRWEVTVAPGSKEDLTVSIGPFTTCSDEGAVCAAADEVLSNKVEKTIEGPPGLSVADARVHEAEGATVDFAVTLGRASQETVTVAYATSDGTAAANQDYEPASGTLTFEVGETAKTVAVAVLDDAHDEGEETFTLTLSNPTGNAWLKDATATGTIENTGPMPQAWLARFGRTVASQVIDAVEGRLSAERAPGVAVSVAGQALGGASADAIERLEEREAGTRLEALSDWFRGGTDGADAGTSQSRALTGRDILTGTSFALTEGSKQAGFASLWGRGAVSRFDGREGELTLEGEVTSAMLGADFTRELGTVGLMLTLSRGEGSYRGQSEGTVESTLTGLYPYGRYEVNERVALWGVAGYGTGTLTLTPKDQPAMKTDMDLRMGAVGVRAVAVEAPAEGGVELSVTSDAMAVRTSSDAVSGDAGGNLAAATADVTRLRLGLEGTWRGGGTLTPTLELGLRHDGGDAETGFGLEVGGGLAWFDPASGVSAELRARGLVTHEAGGFRDRGIAGSLGWDPRPGSERGPSLTLSQTLGASASGGVDALLGRGTLEGLAANDDGNGLGNRRLDLKLGYGVGVFGDRFTATPEVGLGLSNGHREVSLGWRLGLEGSGPVSMELGLEGTRREAANDDGAAPEHALMLGGSLRW